MRGGYHSTLYRYIAIYSSFCRKELSSFTGQPEIITFVALVRPKAAVFVEEISHLLVLCTSSSISLLGLSLTPGSDDRPRKRVEFFVTGIKALTQVGVVSIAGMPDGRIFMAGAQDGCLYEFFYQRQDAWFGKRIQLINHSVGHVQSLLPRFAAPNNDGKQVSNVSRYSTLALVQIG